MEQAIYFLIPSSNEKKAEQNAVEVTLTTILKETQLDDQFLFIQQVCLF